MPVAKSSSSIKPVYALLGDDPYLQLQRLGEIVGKFPADVQRMDYDGERAQLADVLDELRSFAMFGGGKLVVVRDADEFISRFREQLEDYLARPSDSATLVLRVKSLPKNQRIYKAIGKAGEVVECAPPSERALPGWIVNQAKRVHHITLAPDAANLLAELVGSDLGRLDNELAKLALTCDDTSKPIDTSTIYNCVAFQREQELKEMTIELATGKPTQALRRWRQLVALDPSAEFRAITWIGMWLEDVGVVVHGGDVGKLTWKYKDRMTQFITAAKAMGKAGHARAVDLLAEIDKQTKTGVGEASENVERFILSRAIE